MITLQEVDIRCDRCGDPLNGRPNGEVDCRCGDITLYGTRAELARPGASGTITREQWVDGCVLIAEGSPRHCNEIMR